jgi:DNA-binding transcriptional MocR family regulator
MLAEPLNSVSSDVLTPGSNQTLVEQIVNWYSARIEERSLRPGVRISSIRQFSTDHSVSRFTVVEAYDRLVARGYVESRRGSGFFVKSRPSNLVTHDLPRTPNWADATSAKVDVVWLLRNMFKKLPPRDMPGCGVLPSDWLDEEIVASSLRALGRGSSTSLLDYGVPQGYLPLRQQLQLKLAGQDIAVTPEQIVTVNGVTQGLDLVAQHYLKPGDCVMVDEPSWFLIFGRFAQLGVRIISVPRLPDGPDLATIESLVKENKPKIYLTVSVLHNPTSCGLSSAKAYQILRLAEHYDFMIIEDDIYSDLHPGLSSQPALRLAALDQLRRVIYLGGFSKTLAANLRVGFIACNADLARELTDRKLLVGLTSSELGERIVYRVLSEGHYRKHLDRLRERLDRHRDSTIRAIEKLGFKLFSVPSAGMFLWADAGTDSNAVAQTMLEKGFLMAPGSLFLPDQRPSTWMRFNVATSNNFKMLDQLARTLEKAR